MFNHLHMVAAALRRNFAQTPDAQQHQIRYQLPDANTLTNRAVLEIAAAAAELAKTPSSIQAAEQYRQLLSTNHYTNVQFYIDASRERDIAPPSPEQLNDFTRLVRLHANSRAARPDLDEKAVADLLNRMSRTAGDVGLDAVLRDEARRSRPGTHQAAQQATARTADSSVGPTPRTLELAVETAHAIRSAKAMRNRAYQHPSGSYQREEFIRRAETVGAFASKVAELTLLHAGRPALPDLTTDDAERSIVDQHYRTARQALALSVDAERVATRGLLKPFVHLASTELTPGDVRSMVDAGRADAVARHGETRQRPGEPAQDRATRWAESLANTFEQVAPYLEAVPQRVRETAATARQTAVARGVQAVADSSGALDDPGIPGGPMHPRTLQRLMHDDRHPVLNPERST